MGYELFDPKFSLKMPPPTSGGHNFLASNSILTIFSAIDAS
jgi:hypothetical protein